MWDGTYAKVGGTVSMTASATSRCVRFKNSTNFNLPMFHSTARKLVGRAFLYTGSDRQPRVSHFTVASSAGRFSLLKLETYFFK